MPQETTQEFRIPASMASGGIQTVIAAASLGALMQPKQASGAPYVIVRESVGTLLNHGRIKFGQHVPGLGFLLQVLEPRHSSGERLGNSLAFFSSSRNLSSTPQPFSKNQKDIGNLGENWDGEYSGLIRSGWKFEQACAEIQSRVRHARVPTYEELLLRAFKIPMGESGSALGRYTMPLHENVSGRDRKGNTVHIGTDMFALHRKEILENGQKNILCGTFISTGSSFDAKYLQDCTEFHGRVGYVFSTHFRSGAVHCDDKNEHKSLVRPIVALPLSYIPRDPA